MTYTVDLFWQGYWDADLDLDPEFTLPFGSIAYGNEGDEYYDGYTSRWFPLPPPVLGKNDIGVTQTWRDFLCGNRKDLPKKQRVHDYVSLGVDIKNRGEKGICEVIVFACSRCGRDWRE
jgi:hypothetical protein